MQSSRVSCSVAAPVRQPSKEDKLGGRDGGTQMWCKECREVRVCRAVSSAEHASGQRYYNKRHPDIQWFERTRECLTCSSQWETREVDRALIDELIVLRNAVNDVRVAVRASLSEVSKADHRLRRIKRDID